jgi:glycine C-acetyltransferase
MNTDIEYQGGENFDLRQALVRGRTMCLQERVDHFHAFMHNLAAQGTNLTLRCITSAADRVVEVWNPETGRTHQMLMFGSNNYLGLANHPSVRRRAREAIREYGAGIGGPPLLNGYTALHRELERRIAELKGTDDALLFSSGYGANVGLVTGLAGPHDCVVYDAYSHASFCDGMKMAGVEAHRFRHNDLGHLRTLLEQVTGRTRGDVFVGVEGVYSMDGDVAPLDDLLRLCNAHGATLMVDDAHGTGVMGERGRGTAEYCGVEGKIPVTMGTFSKTFAVTGGFVAASRPLVEYLRYFARSYMFSASLPPAAVATVLAGLDVLEREPRLLDDLRRNVALAGHLFNAAGFVVSPEAAIIPLLAPPWMNIRRAAKLLHEKGVFVNSIEYPAVPVHQQRFRVSIMATHREEDIRRLVTVMREVWTECAREAGKQVEDGQLAA